MPPTLSPQLKRALADRIRYYNELGIYDFYRREIHAQIQIQPEQREPLPKAKAAALVDFCHVLLNSNEFLYVD